jgi:glycerate 2-kinase
VTAALCAPDSFKGTLSAAEVAAAMSAGLRAAGLRASELPLADGGEGTMEVLVEALGGGVRKASVSDPLGRPIEAGYAILEDGRAVVEVAAASGLTLVDPGERDAWAASSRGTGELIAAAVAAGAGTVLIAAGGSATTDGGEGALEALAEAGAAPRLVVLCDVRIPFERAPSMFGPQKGADAGTVMRLERRLREQAAAAQRDPRGVAMSGAAGGLAGGLWARLGAELVGGADWVLDEVGFDRRVSGCELVLTGEGRLDGSTPEGKLVGALARRCRKLGTRCCAIVGGSELSKAEAAELGLADVVEAGDPDAIAAAAAALAAGG